ncbi:MAG TPA: RHS repeat-associated core domain-containing protein [Bacteroidales bacterium]|nr:RHS repeat-associated core domain-containing protein [Bacteroidales bacterium]
MFDTRYKFTAKELDNETSYTYFGARYYDSELSGWLSVDPLSDKYPSLCFQTSYWRSSWLVVKLWTKYYTKIDVKFNQKFI